MTFRLVGLMSIVLLLCLATFAFTMEHYQEEVMTELAKTVSEVGKATFHSIEGRKEVYVSNGVVAVSPGCPAPIKEKVIDKLEQRSEEDRHIFVMTSTITDKGSDAEQSVIEVFETAPGAANGERQATFRIVYADAISVVGDPEHEMRLRIPVSGMVVDSGQPSAGQLERVWFEEKKDQDLQEILLPIPTSDYKELFASFGRKSMILFCGVFAIGILLSTGLASRFTRPVRRLDAGIRRLADGDLDVQVLVRGKDEVARLGLAFNEMTRRLRAGRERARQLTRREKLEALGRLGAGVAHDVRNPLHSIGLTLQHLEETCRPEQDDRSQKFDRSIGIIKEEIRRLDRLVENFLRFARSDREARRLVDPASIVEETASLVRKEAEWRKIKIELETNRPLPMIEVDTESVRSSLLNLVLNSFEAMPEGGNLKIAVRGSDDAVCVKVSDTGIGIPETELERVFEFAYSTREGGSGLGLAMVHQCVVEEHAGQVRLESEEGSGTTVILEFPAPGTATEDES